MQVYALCHDPRSGRLLAGVSHPYFGTNVRYSDDRNGSVKNIRRVSNQTMLAQRT